MKFNLILISAALMVAVQAAVRTPPVQTAVRPSQPAPAPSGVQGTQGTVQPPAPQARPQPAQVSNPSTASPKPRKASHSTAVAPSQQPPALKRTRRRHHAPIYLRCRRQGNNSYRCTKIDRSPNRNVNRPTPDVLQDVLQPIANATG
ncbi:hypothetical protein PSACC_00625 [Paramicrosporidium saccamoebae]|uniref:Uncharacterized protein n=1 Tax=Paramicrosporidium saccamoebae TaxID=1246581 RepID=A0A2H9TP79_9FUNG|nr:hypothetical protein PSACC_00625 [Paramicrosporidium saccamoebae]